MQFHSAKAVVQAYKAGHLASNANKAVNLELLMELVRMNGFNVTEDWVREVLNEETPSIEIVFVPTDTTLPMMGSAPKPGVVSLY